MSRQVKWDKHWLLIATQIGTPSKGPTVKIGAVIVDPNKRLVSTGYCGFAKGVIDSEERYLNRDIKLKLGIHAELNAILFAQKDLTGCTIYCTHFTCAQCASNIIQVGINRVVVYKPDDDGFYTRWKDDIDLAHQIYSETDVEVVYYNKPE
jgi:dCMP deaminase